MDNNENNNGTVDNYINNAEKNVTNRKKEQSDVLSKAENAVNKYKRKSKSNGIQKKLMQKAIASLGPLLPYILIAVVIILLIIIIVGIIAYIVTMPGMMAGKIKSVFRRVETGIRMIYENEATASVNNDDIVQLANYIYKMDYDLIGYGFVKPKIYDETHTVEYLEENEGWVRVVEDIPRDQRGDDDPAYRVFLKKGEETYSQNFYDVDGREYGSNGLPKEDSDGHYTKYGIEYDEDDNVSKINDDTSIIGTYAIGERRLYVIRNSDENVFKKLGIAINEFLNGYSGAWAHGLLELYEADNGKATDLYSKWSKGNIEITGARKMRIKFAFSNPMDFELQGWTGRYGLSTDFLISLHLATLSPDLVTTIVQTFDTRAQVYLDYVKNAQVIAYFHSDEMPQEVYLSFHAFEDNTSFSVSNAETKKLMDKYNIKSIENGDPRYNCKKPNGKLCSDDPDLEEACSNCETYFEDIHKGLKNINADSFQTYIPYLARVVGSWFRDTYFIVPDQEDKATKKIYEDYEKNAVDNDDIEYKEGDLLKENIKIIENHDEFLASSGELWTRYILDKDDEDYAIFVIRSDGKYFESESDIDPWKEKLENGVDIGVQIPSEIYDAITVLEKDDETYYGYIDVKTEVSEEQKKLIAKEINRYKEKEPMELLFDYYEIPHVKRAKKGTFDDKKSGVLDAGGWSAYAFLESGNQGEILPLDIDDDTNSYIVQVQNAYNTDRHNRGREDFPVFYYKMNVPENIVQIEDGQRGMTNYKIKYLFKNKKYYRYDGTITTAYAIRDDWKEVLDYYKNTSSGNSALWESTLKEIGRTAIKSFLGIGGFIQNLLDRSNSQDRIVDAIETALNGYIDLVYYEKDISAYRDKFKFARDLNNDGKIDIASYDYQDSIGTTVNGAEITEDTRFSYDPRNPDLISKVDLNTDSLAAFSILENTHTPDADYAYRDLKELFVELDYFDTEDVMTPAKDILEWPLPKSDSAGWPNRVYDKKDDIFGTFIHSKKAYDDLNAIYSNNSVSPSNTENGAPAPDDESTSLLYDEDKILKLASRDDNRNNSDTPYKKSTFLETAKACWDVVVDKQPGYGRNYYAADWHRSNQTLIDCSQYVGWVLYNYGYNDYGLCWTETIMNQSYSGKYGFQEYEYAGEIPISDIQPGDIITRENVIGDGQGDGHTQIVKEVNVEQGYTIVYDCGQYSNWSPSNRNGMQSTFFKASDRGKAKIIRVEGPGNSNSSNGSDGSDINYVSQNALDTRGTAYEIVELKTFDGYEKGEPIVSPATAKVLEIGNVTVNNETKEQIMEAFYVSDDAENETATGTTTGTGTENAENSETSNNTDNDSQKGRRYVVSQDVYDSISSTAEEKQNDSDSPIGKSYTTGYVKLEIIGAESLAKFDAASDEIKTYADLMRVFYREYHNGDTEEVQNDDSNLVRQHFKGNAICDRYTIYIEGIDLTGSMEDSSGTSGNIDIDSTIMGQQFASNGGGSLSSATNVTTNDGSTAEEATEETEETESENSTSGSDEIKINYYTKRKIPEYYNNIPAKETLDLSAFVSEDDDDDNNDASIIDPHSSTVKTVLEAREKAKKAMPSMIKLNNDLYIKAGTILGVTGNANIRIIMKDEDESVVENVEDYLEIEGRGSLQSRVSNQSSNSNGNQSGNSSNGNSSNGNSSNGNSTSSSRGGPISASENGTREAEKILQACRQFGMGSAELAIIEEAMPAILQVQSQYDLDPLAVIAVGHHESNFGSAYSNRGNLKYRIFNIQRWSGMDTANCVGTDGGFTCWNSYGNAVLDFGNYVRNSDALRGSQPTMQELEHYNGLSIFEGAGTADAATYEQLKQIYAGL